MLVELGVVEDPTKVGFYSGVIVRLDPLQPIPLSSKLRRRSQLRHF
jgi:hypothetical protein